MRLDKVLSGIIEVLFDVLPVGPMQCTLLKPPLFDDNSISVYKLVVSVEVVVLVPANPLLSIRKDVPFEPLIYPLLVHKTLFNDANLPNYTNKSIWLFVFDLACEDEAPVVGFVPLFGDRGVVESYSVFFHQALQIQEASLLEGIESLSLVRIVELAIEFDLLRDRVENAF